MALGTENLVYHQQPPQYQLQQQRAQQQTPIRGVLRTRIVNQQRSLAPAPYKKPSANNCLLGGTTLDSNNPAVVRRNARERSRVKLVNNGFSTLRQHIPTAIIAEISNGRRGIGPGADKKLSKVDTLRMAAEYIRRLKKLIDEVDNSDTSSVCSFGATSSTTYADSSSSSPPPSHYNGHNVQSTPMQQTALQYCPPLSYAGSFQQYHLISPANSCSSNECYQFHRSPHDYQSSIQSTFALNTPKTTPIKMEPPSFNFDDYQQNHTSSVSTTDDEELLDYISLWQDQ